jgi:hypothetical protein
LCRHYWSADADLPGELVVPTLHSHHHPELLDQSDSEEDNDDNKDEKSTNGTTNKIMKNKKGDEETQPNDNDRMATTDSRHTSIPTTQRTRASSVINNDESDEKKKAEEGEEVTTTTMTKKIIKFRGECRFQDYNNEARSRSPMFVIYYHDIPTSLRQQISNLDHTIPSNMIIIGDLYYQHQQYLLKWMKMLRSTGEFQRESDFFWLMNERLVMYDYHDVVHNFLLSVCPLACFDDGTCDDVSAGGR